jgi:uncharacterized protein YbjT (DUF2867 family)
MHPKQKTGGEAHPATTSKTVLVTGATGRQGGAVARRLLRGGWRVRALTRDPSNPAARGLAERGAEVIPGDLNDRTSLERALANVYGVFSVQDYRSAGYDGEVRQGKTLAEAANAAGVRHFVYSSVAAANSDSGLPQFESKWKIEQRIRQLDLPATILRPVSFMENFEAPPLRKAIRAGLLIFPMRSDKALQMIAVDDIAAFAALALENPKQYIGATLELAGDELTMPQAAAVFSRVLGRRVGFVRLPLLLARIFMPQEMVRMFNWFNEKGFHAKIPTLRARYPELTTLEAWLRRSGWDQAKR